MIKRETDVSAEFEFENLRINPYQAEPGQTVTVSIDVKNIGKSKGSQKLELKVDGESEQIKKVDLDANLTTTINFYLSREISGEYNITIEGLSGSFKVLKFELKNLTINPTRVKPGDTVNISVDVKNTGEIEGTLPINLIIDNEVKSSRDVSLSAGESTRINFSVVKTTPGTYIPVIGNMSGRFIVEKYESIEGNYERHYEWMYRNSTYSSSITIPKSLYQYFKELSRPKTPSDYSILVSNQKDDEYIQTLTRKLQKLANQKNLRKTGEINLAISFVQGLPYTPDEVTTPFDEYPRFPIETLVDEGGDCEDTSVLLAEILKNMDYETRLILLPEHMAVGILGDDFPGFYYMVEGEKYYYIETTGVGWEIGEIPKEYESVSAEIIELSPKSIIISNWEATLQGNSGSLNVDLQNIGTATAEEVYVLAGFDAGDNKLWNPEESPKIDIRQNENVSLKMTLEVPSDKYTRIIVQIIDNGYAVETSHSDWFGT